ncbi:hypothetical protein HMPREF0322_00392 [Desulfitobacterium hafniense DP7]|uniref:Phage protein Gp138 N-terminal domain-containing protein n=1 Tax=Desulfitobacterium hafniense DP7 TaxID=537010 RepID=G9XHG7_DESHA|nr:Gp138 family membrane-puncturing spike protein [Desulfitobacterium hafniense]EHL08969.1 hypothetical protein HMPREF0322_00392 [Desulfitobacterium hafniense DP7]
MRTVGERIGSEFELYQRLTNKVSNDIRVAVPGIIQSFDAGAQTATVQPAIREKIVDPAGNVSDVALPLLLDVPVVFPKAGGFAITFPVKKGDECLVVFGDMCIDGWWSAGGIQNQLEKRRHDLSDGFAILGVSNQPNKVQNYNASNLEIRSLSGGQKIELSDNGINLVGNVRVNGVPIHEI